MTENNKSFTELLDLEFNNGDPNNGNSQITNTDLVDFFPKQKPMKIQPPIQLKEGPSVISNKDFFRPPSPLRQNTDEQLDDIFPVVKNDAAFLTNGTRVFHVICDSDFDINLENEKMSFNFDKYRPSVLGKIRNLYNYDEKIGIPVVYDLKDAIDLANRMATIASVEGTIKGKKHPIFGAIVLEFDIGSMKQNHYDYKNDIINIKKHDDENDYSMFRNFTEFASGVMSYVVEPDDSKKNIDTGKTKSPPVFGTRGFIPYRSLNQMKLVSARYGNKFEDVPQNVGFYLFNQIKDLDEDDLIELKKIYKNNVYYNGYSENNNLHGGDINYYNKYISEKAKYLKLKKLAQKRNLI
jgi:hypothetical protein